MTATNPGNLTDEIVALFNPKPGENVCYITDQDVVDALGLLKDDVLGTSGGGGGGTTAVQVGAGAPTQPPTSGDIYLDTSKNELYVWDGNNWLKASATPVGATIFQGTVPPTDPTFVDPPGKKAGDVYLDESNHVMYAWDGGKWNAQTQTKGAEVHSGTGPPSTSLGRDGDVYVDTLTSDLYTKAGGTWTITTHTPQPTITSGAGAPTVNGVTVGDQYVNTTDGSLYVWDGASWVDQTPPPARQTLSGAGAPANGLGNDGDTYINTNNSQIYTKAGGAWTAASLPAGAVVTTGNGNPVASGITVGDQYIDLTPNPHNVWEWDGANWIDITPPKGGGNLLSDARTPVDATDGQDGDMWIDTTTHIIYEKVGGKWQVESQPYVPPTVSTGTLAARPAAGTTKGDTYIATDKTPHEIYEWSGTAWENLTPQPIKEFLSGTVDPTAGGAPAAAATAPNGTLYLNTTSHIFFEKVGGAWVAQQAAGGGGAFWKMWKGTQAQYNAIGAGNYKADTLYVVHP